MQQKTWRKSLENSKVCPLLCEFLFGLRQGIPLFWLLELPCNEPRWLTSQLCLILPIKSSLSCLPSQAPEKHLAPSNTVPVLEGNLQFVFDSSHLLHFCAAVHVKTTLNSSRNCLHSSADIPQWTRNMEIELPYFPWQGAADFYDLQRLSFDRHGCGGCHVFLGVVPFIPTSHVFCI